MEHDGRGDDEVIVVENMQENSANTATKTSKKDRGKYWNQHIRYLLKILPNTAMEEWYNTLKVWWSAKDSYALTMAYHNAKLRIDLEC
eukprot:8487510-Ditylum_brightwellii.AAC.1